MKKSPFDHRQDRQLGEALRSALTGTNEAAFVERVVGKAAEQQGRVYSGGEWWEVLSAWARPGLAASAFGVAAAAMLWFTGVGDQTITDGLPTDPVQASAEIPEVFLTTQPPGLNEVLAMEFGNQ